MVLKVRCSVRSAVGRGSERLLAVRRTPPIENQYPSTERREMHRVDKGERAKTPVGKTGMGDVVDMRAAIDESNKGIARAGLVPERLDQQAICAGHAVGGHAFNGLRVLPTFGQVARPGFQKRDLTAVARAKPSAWQVAYAADCLDKIVAAGRDAGNLLGIAPFERENQ